MRKQVLEQQALDQIDDHVVFSAWVDGFNVRASIVNQVNLLS